MTPAGEVSPLGRLLALPFIAAIRLYQWTLRPILGKQCRFVPTCSDYGLEAYRTHGPIAGTRLTAWRILRCQPFARGGYDPVPVPGLHDQPANQPANLPAQPEDHNEVDRPSQPGGQPGS